MKLPYTLLLITFLFGLPKSSDAMLNEGLSVDRPIVLTCPIGFDERAHIINEIEKLSERLYLASLEAMLRPEQFIITQYKVKKEMRALIQRNGLTCMIELGAPHTILPTHL